MLRIRGVSLRLLRPATPLLSSIRYPNTIISTSQTIVHKTTVRKKKNKSGEVSEKDSVKRLRLKRKVEKEKEKKRRRLEKEAAERKARFRLPPLLPRPDAVPFGTALRILRGWGVKQSIFVRSIASRWAGETKVVALVRVVPNEHNPKPIRGRVVFPHPPVLKTKEGKKERIAIIVEEEKNEEATKAGMIVGGEAYLEKIVKWVSEGTVLPFDVLLATPKSVSLFRKHGRILGPKGLMPSEKRGTVIEDLGSYGPREEKGTELKLEPRSKNIIKGSQLKIVVGKFKQDDHQIEENLKSLINTIHKLSAGSQIPFELSLYSTLHPTLVRQNPYLTIQNTIHVPKLSANGTPKLQQPKTVYPPDRAGYGSTASFLVPIANFHRVGHPQHYEYTPSVKRYAAAAEWMPLPRNVLRQLAKYKAGIESLKSKETEDGNSTGQVL